MKKGRFDFYIASAIEDAATGECRQRTVRPRSGGDYTPRPDPKCECFLPEARFSEAGNVNHHSTSVIMTITNSSLTTREALRSWLNEVHGPDGTASLNGKRVVEDWFTDDVELRYANYPTITGKDKATGLFETQYNALDGLTHDVPDFDFIAPNKLYQPATVRWLVKGDDPAKDWIEVQAMSTFWLTEEDSKLKIRRAEIVLDVNEVTERMKSKGLL